MTGISKVSRPHQQYKKLIRRKGHAERIRGKRSQLFCSQPVAFCTTGDEAVDGTSPRREVSVGVRPSGCVYRSNFLIRKRSDSYCESSRAASIRGHRIPASIQEVPPGRVPLAVYGDRHAVAVDGFSSYMAVLIGIRSQSRTGRSGGGGLRGLTRQTWTGRIRQGSNIHRKYGKKPSFGQPPFI